MYEPCERIIDRLIEERRARGMTQRDLAVAIGQSQAAIGRLESKKHMPQLDTLLRIADALECDISVERRCGENQKKF